MPAICARLARLEASRFGRALTDLSDGELHLSCAWINAQLAFGRADPPLEVSPALAARLAHCLPDIEPGADDDAADNEYLEAEVRRSLVRELVDAQLAVGADLADASIETLARCVVGSDVVAYLDRACAAVEAERGQACVS